MIFSEILVEAGNKNEQAKLFTGVGGAILFAVGIAHNVIGVLDRLQQFDW
ncbi:MAG: hypothetical protein HY707_07620 [Ignavibacteriae bacterium]|nr:hypothetical protein [Ignavibacteriota bacterium]